MKHYTNLSILAGLCLLALTTITNAQQNGALDVPRTISYQGMLTTTDGVPLPDGVHRITVTLYADAEGTQVVWQDSYDAPTTQGIFNLYLGSRTPLPSTADMNRPLWVGTAVDGTTEMSPLTPLTSSPYALNLPDRAVTTGKLADGAVTAEKVDMDYVAGFRVNGAEVTGRGTMLDIRGSDDIALEYDKEMNVLNISRANQGTTGDAEKGGASVLATNNDVWTMRGNGRSLAGGFPLIAPVAGDYIGTNNTVTLELRTNNTTAMRYQPNGTNTPNIVGGFSGNSVTAASIGSTIAGGGQTNRVNTIDNDAEFAVIGGGQHHIISADHGTIGGGEQNRITSNGLQGTIPGGKQLQSQSFAQTVVGFYNLSTGSIGPDPIVTSTGQYNVPLFMVGNGNSGTRSNAFEVSYNGHSIVFDENGTGGALGGSGRGAVEGGTYTDNVIYGWAEVGASGYLLGSCGDFGVDSIALLSNGVYRIWLNPVAPDGTARRYISCGAVVATLGTGGDPDEEGPSGLYPCWPRIVTSRIKNNVFEVYISQYDPFSGQCAPTVLPFNFHVTGRLSTSPTN